VFLLTDHVHFAERIWPAICGVGEGEFVEEATMGTSIIRYPKSTALTGLAVLSKGIEYGFIAAGVTVAAVAAVQSIGIVLSWIAAGR
jgi:hypothetical protein